MFNGNKKPPSWESSTNNYVIKGVILYVKYHNKHRWHYKDLLGINFHLFESFKLAIFLLHCSFPFRNQSFN